MTETTFTKLQDIIANQLGIEVEKVKYLAKILSKVLNNKKIKDI